MYAFNTLQQGSNESRQKGEQVLTSIFNERSRGEAMTLHLCSQDIIDPDISEKFTQKGNPHSPDKRPETKT